MDTTYKGRIKDFALNRFLRLFPTYWFTIALVVLLIYLNIPVSRQDIGIPEGWELVRALLYVNHWKDNPTFITTGWAVTNEIVWYVAIAFGISKTPARSVTWLAVSIIFTVSVMLLAPHSSDLRYFSPLAGSLPFAYGASLYHFRSRFSDTKAKRTAVVSSIALALCLVVGSLKWIDLIPRYAFLVASGPMAVSLYLLGRKTRERQRNRDRVIGDLSYPIYLNHYAAASLVVWISPFHLKSIALFLAVFTASTLIAFATNFVIDRNVGKIRNRIRQRKPRTEAYSPVLDNR
ncbi:acyltransferase [Brucella tritici]|uniref:Acyltransferase n=2 Tax=Brucella tritici TaxID=94626 RepID=A0A6L3YVW1_9HYPH|nr:acyltransferase [Brucella tritici]